MSTLSRREKLLLPLLPAAGLVLFYTLAIRGGDTTAGLRRQIERAKADIPSVAKVETKRTELRAERDAVEALRARVAHGAHAGAASPSLSPGNVARAEAGVLLGGFIQESGLLLLEERVIDPSDDPTLRLPGSDPTATPTDGTEDDKPPVLAKRSQARATQSNYSTSLTSKGPELWELRFAGRFEQMRAFTLRLGEPQWPMFPVALSMETSLTPDNPVRIWRLWIWR